MAKAKKIRGLKCNAPATPSIRVVLSTRLNEMIEWRKTALDWTDPEGVHAMRVASRRLRSTMRDFLPYVPKKSFTSVIKQLKSLADALGAVRDQDVAIQALEEIAQKAPGEYPAALQQSIEKRKELREGHRKKLEAVLDKNELAKLQTDFTAALEEAVATAERKNKRATTLTFAAVSGSIIRDRLKEFEKRTAGLFTPLDMEALHDLRIATKRLRYAIELAVPCFDRSIAAHAKRAARIQTTLGDLHDCDTWIVTIGKEIARARKQKAEPQLAALIWLLNHFTMSRTKHLQRAFIRWREWEAHDVNEQLRAAVKIAKPAQPEAQDVAVASEPQADPLTDPQTGPQNEPQTEPPEHQDQGAGEQMRQAL
jgi:CHAD domain-containing protein